MKSISKEKGGPIIRPPSKARKIGLIPYYIKSMNLADGTFRNDCLGPTRACSRKTKPLRRVALLCCLLSLVSIPKLDLGTDHLVVITRGGELIIVADVQFSVLI